MKMKQFHGVSLFTLLLASITVGSSGETNTASGACTSDIEPLISGPRYRVHEQFFSTNLADSATLNESQRLDGRSWCSPVSTQQPWLGVEFGCDVVIHSLLTAGYDGFTGDYYVVSFQVHVGGSRGDLEPLVMPNSSVPVVFERPAGFASVQTDLPYPVTTRVLRIVVLSWHPQNDELCIGVEALGCLGHTVCENESLLTTNRSLLPITSITASSPAEDNPGHLVSTGEEWCSTEGLTGGPPSPYVQLNFTERVTLSYMVARGGSTLGLSYVTGGFILEVLDNAGGFMAYRVNDDESSEATVFTADSASEVLYTLWQPARGVVFRFSIISGQRNVAFGDFCWNIKVFGCLDNGNEKTTTVPVHVATTDRPVSMATTYPTGTTADFTVATTETTQATQESSSSDVGMWVGLGFGIFGLCGVLLCVGVFTVAIVMLASSSETDYIENSRSYCTKSPSVTSLDSLPNSPSGSHQVENAIYGMEMKSLSLSPPPPPPPMPVPKQEISATPSVHTYESLPPRSSPSHSDSLLYDYVDNMAIRVNADSAAQTQCSTTTGFKVQADVDDESMEKNAAYEHA